MSCISCGRDEDLHKVDHIGNLMACGHCIGKHSVVELALEADRLLTEWFIKQKLEAACPCCKGPLMAYPDNSMPAWCQSCEAKRRAYVNAS